MNQIVITSKPDADVAEKWNAFLANAPFATHYTNPNYFTDPYVRGDRFAVLATDQAGQITAVLTGVSATGNIASGMFSRPQTVFRTDIDKDKAAAALLEGIRQMANGKHALIDIFTWQPVEAFSENGMHSSPSNESTSVVMLDLAAGADAIFAKFSQTRRNEIRKTIRQGLVEIKELETDNELEAMYQIHCDWNARKGNTPDTIEQMSTAVRQRDNRRVFIAKVDEKVVAGSFYRFCPGGVVEYAANFSLPEYQRLRPNDLIGWHAIQWACGAGFSHFSMGGSHLFLRRFGGEVMQTWRYRRDNSRFRLHDLKENARVIGLGAYRRLPENVRTGMRRILAR